jgi:hypothetical protein
MSGEWREETGWRRPAGTHMLSHSLAHKERSIHQEGGRCPGPSGRTNPRIALRVLDGEEGRSVAPECFSCPENITFSFEVLYSAENCNTGECH